MSTTWIRLRGRAIGVVALCFGVACSHELDTERAVPSRASLGAEIYRIFCKRIAASELPNDVSGRETRALCAGDEGPETAPTERLRAMAENRDRLVAALDRTLPEELEDDLDSFMVQLVPFYDPPDERLPNQTRALADLLADIAEDDAAVGALERVSTRVGYRPLRLALGVTRPFLSYPRVTELTQTALATIDDGGSASAEWDTLLRAVALELATSTPDEPTPRDDSTLAITRDLLFRTDAAFGDGTALFLTRRDRRGIVLPAGGTIAAPFVDMNGDSLADVDPLGRFVGEAGGLLELPPPFRTLGEVGIARDPSGRALRETDRSPIYATLDVDATLLAGLTRESVGWLDPERPTLLNLAQGLSRLLGPEAMRTETLGDVEVRYAGYETSQGPLFDLVHGVGNVIDDTEVDDTLALTEILLADYEHELAGVIDSGLYGDAVADADTTAALAENAELWDDVIQVGEWIAQEPGLMEALLRALADPRSKRLGAIYAEMMRHRDEVGWDTANPNRPMRDQVWDDPVDHAAADTPDNESLFQRSIAIIHDLDGVRVCNKDGARLRLRALGLSITYPLFGGSFDECELLEIDNVAEAYALAIAGRYQLELKDGFLNAIIDFGDTVGLSVDDILEDSSGIDGLTRRPTPEAMNRLVFQRSGNPFLEDLLDPVPQRDGVPIENRHDPIVFAWEREFHFCGDDLYAAGTAPCAAPERVTFYEAMTPLIEAFDSFDRRTSDRFLFGRLITALHMHWPSARATATQDDDPAAPFYVHQDDGRSYEPIVSELFADCSYVGGRCDAAEGGKLVSRLHELVVQLDGVELRPGVDGIDVLAAAGEKLIDPARNPGLANRRGIDTTFTNDRTREIPYSPLLLLLDSLNEFDEAFVPVPDRLTRWRDARSAIVDQLLTVRERGGRFELENRRAHALTRTLVPFVRERVAAHRTAGDLDEWSLSLAPRLETTLGSAVGSASLQFLEAVDRDEVAKEELSGLIQYLMSDASDNDAFDNTLLATADLMQLLDDDLNLVPLLNVLSEGLAPGVRERVAGGGSIDPSTLDLDGSTLDETVKLMRAIVDVDDRRTLAAVLRNLVALPEGSDGETPLETVVDVIAEVNRTEPGLGTSLRAEDHRAVLGHVDEFLTDPDRGLERIYRVVQNRVLTE
ncbi:MAG: hypothetical protein H6722_28295 [Sandaracinus sp.]|nr:hypothetical protein [Sandaracinus sp.]